MPRFSYQKVPGPYGTMVYKAKRLKRSKKGAIKSTKVKKAITTIAKKVIEKKSELKLAGQQVVNDAFNSTISASSECYRVLPDVSPGTAANNRIGDKIRPKYLIIKGKLAYDTSVINPGSYIPMNTVRVMILSQRSLNLSTDVGSRADVSHLLRDNINTDVARAYTGSMFDNLAPINKDLFKVHMDKKFKMKAILFTELGNASDTGTKWLAGTQSTHYFQIKIKCPATLNFDDGNANTPNNFAPFVCLGAVSDGNEGAFTATTPYRLTVLSSLYFYDN